MKYRRWWCNCRAPICWLDSLLHGLYIHNKRICDAHDRHIMAPFE